MNISTNENAETFVILVQLFQSTCDSYKSNKSKQSEESIIQLFANISTALSKKPKLYQTLVKENWCKSVTDLLKIILVENNFPFFNQIINFLINFTDISGSICESLVQAGVADVLIDLFLKFQDNVAQKSNNKHVFVTILSLVHNIARHVHLQQHFMQHANINRFKEVISTFCSDASIDTSIVATFVLIWLAKEDDQDESSVICQNAVIIEKIFKYIKNIFIKDEKPVTCWTMCELLEGLQALSSINDIKCRMIMLDEFVITLIAIIRSSKSTEKEIELSLGILWNLSFVESNRCLLQTEYNIASIIEPFTKSASKQIRNNSKGLLWDLRKEQSKCTGPEAVAKYDIFLSYSHAQKELVSKIETHLKKDFTVWIDEDSIKGSSLEDMALGIERSKLFVMCVSNSYKHSQFCQSEANYAYRIKRPIIPLLMEHKYKPDGWLGIMISPELYIDVSDWSKLNESMTKLRAVVNYKSKSNNSTSENQASKRDKNVKEWDEGQVSKWLTDIGLSDWIDENIFEGFDGKMLDAMINMKEECPMYFYLCLENSMKLKFPDILKISFELSNLKK